MSHGDKLSLTAIFDHIAVAQLPAQHPRLCVAAIVDGLAGVQQVHIALLDPAGHDVLPDDSDDPGVTIPLHGGAAAGRGTLVVEINLLPLEMAGRHTIAFSIAGEQIGTIPFTVTAEETERHEVPSLRRRLERTSLSGGLLSSSGDPFAPLTPPPGETAAYVEHDATLVRFSFLPWEQDA